MGVNIVNKAFFAQIFNEYPGLVFIKNVASVYITANKRVLQHLNMESVEELAGLTDYDLPWKKFAAHYQADDKKAMTQGAFTVLERIVIDNEEITSVVKKFPLFEHGNIVAVAGVTTLLSDTKDLGQYFTENLNSSFLYLQKTIGALSKRESQCFFYFIRGNSASNIADRLKISKRTVEQHLDNIKIKLNCTNKKALLEKAFQDGFIYCIPEGIIKL